MNPRQPFAGLSDRDEAQLRVDVHRHSPAGFALSVEGELERTTAPVLAGCLRRLVAVARSPETLMVNFGRVTFIDVGGLRVLLDGSRCAFERGCTLRLTDCSRPALRLVRAAEADVALDVASVQVGPSARPSDRTSRAAFPLVSV
jgi:anti-anti-sigma factor